MIDLEDSLSALVDRAPAPPEVANVVRRGRQRQWRRRGLALATALALLAAGIGGIATIASSRRAAHVSVLTPGIQHVRVTLLNGSQLEISGPPSLGLTHLAPAFNGELDPVSPPQYGVGHTFSVQRTAPAEPGAVVGRYPTHDGHELVVYTTAYGFDAVVQYQSWALVVGWGHDPVDWAAFATALNAKETADGYLVVEPVDASWRLGPGDGPDAQLGNADGSRAALAFFGPAWYPAGCPTAAEATRRTAQGWPASLPNGASWCDADAKVRVGVWNPDLVDAALQDLRVAYTDPDHAIATVTTLDGAQFEITAPASELDHFIVQKGVTIADLQTPSPIVIEAERSDDARQAGDAPHRTGEPAFTSGDGHQLVMTQFPQGDDALEGIYGDWTVYVTVTGLSEADRSRVASLFAAHETADGFLVVDPAPTMHLASGPGSDIVLDHVDIQISNVNGDAEVVNRGNLSSSVFDQIHVRRVG